MKLHNLKSFYITHQIKEHHIHKNILLSLINEIPNNSYENISHTDFNLPKEYKRKYLDYFYNNVIKDYMNNLCNILKIENWNIQEGWFQQYNKKDNHNWHAHPDCQFTNIYFLELPDIKYITELNNSCFNETIDLQNVSEGYVITFPSYILHRSIPINEDTKKTIISFNSNFF